MRINNNLMAMNTHRQLGLATTGGAKSMEKLSSGFRINRAGDDAAGLAISEKMRGQIRGLNQASSNAQDGISLIQTTEGALNETHAILQRMRELAVQSSTDTNTDKDRGEIQKEIDQLSEEITRIADTTQFNTMNLLDGSYKEKKFHIGANEGQDVTLDVNNMDSSALKVSGKIDASYAGADVTITAGVAGTDGTTPAADGTGGAAVDFAAGKYTTVEAADYKGTDLVSANVEGGSAGVTHMLVDADGNAVGTSTDGLEFHAIGDVAFTPGTGVTGTVATDGTRASLTLVAGTKGIEIEAGALTTAKTTIGAEFEEGASLSTGTYTIADDAADTGLELKNDKGEVVAYSADGEAWTSDVEGNVAFMTTETLAAGDELEVGKPKGIDVSSQATASAAITTINDALESVSAERSKLGAMQNRLEHTIKNLDTSAENLQQSESRIRDVDMAKEMMEQTKNNILQQASQAMLAQANQAPSGVLQLLG